MAKNGKPTANRPASQRRSGGKKLQVFKIPPEALKCYITQRVKAAREVGMAEVELNAVKTFWQDQMAAELSDLREAAKVPYLEEGLDVTLRGNLFVANPPKSGE